MKRPFTARSITVRLAAGTSLAMAVLLAFTGAFIYERMSFALNRSIRDVPRADVVEIDARRRHRDEALHELLLQLSLAYGATVAISGFIGFRMARRALSPVEAMRIKAAEGGGDATVRLPVGEGDDELTRLALTLNELLARVERGVVREHQLIADASHELRTPLSLMLMQLDLSLSRERTPAETRLALERLHGETERLIRLANDLLLLARLDEQARGAGGSARAAGPSTAVFPAMRASVERAFPGAERDSMQVRAPDAASVALEPTELAQVLDNLVKNALRHGAPPFELRADHRDGAVTVHVLDRGPGFPEPFLTKAFDRFTTAATGRSGQSSGLGLSIVEAIARGAGGSVGAGNRPGGGADVWVTLPEAPAGERAPDA